jgi:hypothetical protein
VSSNPSLEDLFAAARTDAPSREVQDAVWGRVAATAAAAPAAVVASKAAAAVKTSLMSGGAKLLAVGTVIGAAGAATTIVVVGGSSLVSAPLVSTPAQSVGARGAPKVAGPTTAAPELAAPEAAESVPVVERGEVPGEPAESAPAEGERRPSAGEGPRPRSSAVLAPRGRREEGRVTDAPPAVLDGPSSLAQEAALVTEARAALLRGEPNRALLLARSSSALPTRALEPEELALEARALRALGRSSDAETVENALRQRFPENALAHPKAK